MLEIKIVPNFSFLRRVEIVTTPLSGRPLFSPDSVTQFDNLDTCTGR